MTISKSIIALASILVVILAGFAIYAGTTYPQKTLSSNVSFSIGVDSKVIAFNQPFLDDKVQIQVVVENGAALWRAQIYSGDQVVWEHGAAQGEQTSYTSGWLPLQAGSYNFTFGTIGLGSLDATVLVSSKGGFW